MIPIPFKSFWIKLGGGVILLLGLFGVGYFKGRGSERAKQAVSRVKAQKAVIETAKDAVELQAEAEAEVAAVAQEQKLKRKGRKKSAGRVLGGSGWCFVFLLSLVFLFLVGCGSPRVEIIRPPIMELSPLPRPDLPEVYIEPGMCLSDEDVEKLDDNDFSLKTLILQYEALIRKHQEFVRRYKAQGVAQ